MSNVMLDEDIGQSEAEIAEEAAFQRELNGEDPIEINKADQNVNQNENKDLDKEIDDKLTDKKEDLDLEDKEDKADEEDNNDDNPDDNNDDEQDFEKLSVKVNGQDIEINSEKELRTIVAKLSENSSKTTINNEKRMLEAAGLSKEDIGLLSDIKKGNKAAINEFLKSQKISLDDLDDAKDEEYKTEFDYKEPTAIDQVAEQILSDSTFAEQYRTTAATLPKDFSDAIHSDPVAMENFAKHVKSGLAGEVIPLATKASIVEGIPFMEAYAKIGREVAAKKAGKADEKPARKVDEESRSRRSKRSASRSDAPKEDTPEDIANMSEADFVAKYGE